MLQHYITPNTWYTPPPSRDPKEQEFRVATLLIGTVIIIYGVISDFILVKGKSFCFTESRMANIIQEANLLSLQDVT